MTVRQRPEFSKWLAGLRDRKAIFLINVRIRRLEGGNAGDVKPVGEGISEMRIPHGPGYRLYFVRRRMEIVVLLCGGDKGTQSVDVAKAKMLAKELDNGD